MQYIKEALRNAEAEVGKSEHVLRGKPMTPMHVEYRPELDVSPILGLEQANYYQSLTGILQWVVQLGRIAIYIDVPL
jgi:hypothetical protein